jgi:chloramphenicol 3-O phosphotransferase
MALGTVIVLNGTSSAGKNSLARAIQDVMDDPYLVLGIDVFLEHFPERYLGDMRHAAAATARRGTNVVIDDVILDPTMRADYLTALAGVPTLMVEVCCPPDVLAAREQARGDRNAGMALATLPLIERTVGGRWSIVDVVETTRPVTGGCLPRRPNQAPGLKYAQ